MLKSMKFYSFYFIMPFIILFMVLIHLMFIHETGSFNPLGLNSNFFKIPFNPYYSIKDILGFTIMIMILLLICLINPYMMSDPENFKKANSMITPIHIQPEWYFLFAYAILCNLRSIPNKMGGVIALLMSILILFILPFNMKYNMKGYKFYFINQVVFWMFISLFIILTWIEARPVETPYILIGQISSIMYFSYFLFSNMINKISDSMIYK